eukprot:scaffold22266_cov72-Phaeocystis_antarctica.AAC.1
MFAPEKRSLSSSWCANTARPIIYHLNEAIELAHAPGRVAGGHDRAPPHSAAQHQLSRQHQSSRCASKWPARDGAPAR